VLWSCLCLSDRQPFERTNPVTNRCTRIVSEWRTVGIRQSHRFPQEAGPAIGGQPHGLLTVYRSWAHGARRICAHENRRAGDGGRGLRAPTGMVEVAGSGGQGDRAPTMAVGDGESRLVVAVLERQARGRYRAMGAAAGTCGHGGRGRTRWERCIAFVACIGRGGCGEGWAPTRWWRWRGAACWVGLLSDLQPLKVWPPGCRVLSCSQQKWRYDSLAQSGISIGARSIREDHGADQRQTR